MKIKGFTLTQFLVAVAVIIVAATAGGILVRQKKISLPPITPSKVTPVPTSPTTKIIGPTVGGPVSPGVFEEDLRELPTIKPFDITEYYCKTDADCYDKNGKPKGICSVPCQDKAVCTNGLCIRPNIPGMR